jgi:hypothetical protein
MKHCSDFWTRPHQTWADNNTFSQKLKPWMVNICRKVVHVNYLNIVSSDLFYNIFSRWAKGRVKIQTDDARAEWVNQCEQPLVKYFPIHTWLARLWWAYAVTWHPLAGTFHNRWVYWPETLYTCTPRSTPLGRQILAGSDTWLGQQGAKPEHTKSAIAISKNL